MSKEKYRVLIEAICKQSNIVDPTMYELANLGVNGTNFSLCHGGESAPDSMMVYGDFGPLPNQSREAILLKLLDANLYMSGGPQNPAFAYNAETRRITLTHSLLLDQVTADEVLIVLAQFAKIAADWRKDYFLSPSELKTGDITPARRAPSQGARDRITSQARFAGNSAK
jgi:hypothetical protein